MDWLGKYMDRLFCKDGYFLSTVWQKSNIKGREKYYIELYNFGDDC